MAIPYWPGAVTLNMLEPDYRESPLRAESIEAFQPERGPPLENLATFIPSTMIQGTIRCQTAEEYEALLAFYTNDLRMGILHFTRAHPRTKALGEFKFEGFELAAIVTNGGIRAVDGRVQQFHDVSVAFRYFPAVGAL